MRRILKYELKPYGETVIEIEGMGQILYVDAQHGKPYVWIDVHERLFYKEKKVIHVFQTGSTIPEEYLHKTKFIGTFLLMEGNYVGHAFQIIGE